MGHGKIESSEGVTHLPGNDIKIINSFNENIRQN